jgi:hypothetical protein
MTFRDLAKYGLALTPMENGDGAWLSNESGKAVVALAVIWSSIGPDRNWRTHSHSTLRSSDQMDVLAGRATVGQDRRYNFIMPGSRRQIAPLGIAGDNSDVRPPVPPGTQGTISWAQAIPSWMSCSSTRTCDSIARSSTTVYA